MRQKLTVLLACACALAALVSATAFGAGSDPPPPEEAPPMTTEDGQETETGAPEPDLSMIQRVIQRHRREAWHWERVMGRPLTRQLASASTEAQRRLEAWRRLALSLRRRAQNPPHKQAWLCIHRFEGSWRDPDPPYFGGLQMDVQFQRTYGAAIFRLKGTADHWTPIEQMWAAERAHRSGRGFYPWPNTARYCGLI
jgi:hypothetical protein